MITHPLPMPERLPIRLLPSPVPHPPLAMPTIIDLQALGDAPGTVEVVANALLAGDFVALPMETTYTTAVLPDWNRRRGDEHLKRFTASRAALAFRDFSAVDDLAGPFTGRPLRLLRRCWPGTPVVEFAGLEEDVRLASLPESIKSRLFSEGGLRTTVPRHDFLQQLLRHFPGPLIVSTPSSPDERWSTATEVSKAVGSKIDMLVDDGPTRYDQGATIVRMAGSDFRVVEEGVVSAKAIERMAGEMILFVCTGNTCRSPMAEAVCRRRLAERLGCADDDLLDHGYSVASAGLAATRGAPAADEAVELLEQAGIDLRVHESQSLSRTMLEQADRVMTMTRSHRDSIVSGMPEFAHKVRVLSSQGRDIADPIGGGEREYRDCLNQITTHIDALLDEILRDEGGAKNT